MKNIAILTAGLTVNHAYRIISGINKCITDYDANAFIFTCARRYEQDSKHDIGEYNIYNLPDFNEMDGAVLVNSTVGSDEILLEMAKKIEEAHISAVGIERADPNMFNVHIDNKSAMREIVEHFIKVHGFRRINYISGPTTNQEAISRLKAYQEVLEENGIPIESERIAEGNFLKVSGMLATEQFLNSSLPMPEAIICANDVMAFGAYSILEEHGLRVPEDIALSGFDDDFDAKHHVPSITSVSRSQEQVGYESCKRAILGNCNDNGSNGMVIETKAKYRESCGCREHGSVDNLIFRKRHYEEKSNSETYVDLTRRMSIDLTGVETFKQLKDIMRLYILQIACKEMYFFLCDDFSDSDKSISIYQDSVQNENYLKRGFGKDNIMLIGYDNGNFMEDLKMNFSDFLQNIKNKDKKGNIYVISPIHFRDRCFGYSIIGNSEFPYENQMYYTWLLNIGNAIEMIRKQLLMRSMIDKLDSVWSYDMLTNVFNRSGFKKYGIRVWEDGLRNLGVIVLFMDLDDLKKVNDTYGHEEGDNFIRTFAQLLKNVKRHGEAIMRYGGDEFVILAPLTLDRTAEGYVWAIQEELRKFNEVSSLSYTLDASIGYRVITADDNISLNEAIEIADSQMYQNKKHKKEQKK